MRALYDHVSNPSPDRPQPKIRPGRGTIPSLLAACALFALAALPLTPQPAAAQDPFIGEIRMFAGNFPPRGWAMCDGQILAINQNQALFSILGTTYGGDGQTTFALPDLRGRVPIHPGQGPGLSSYRLGEKSGTEQTILTVQQLPSHTHDIRASGGNGASNSPVGLVPARNAAGVPIYGPPSAVDLLAGNAVTPTGGGQPHENRQPYLSVTFIIALQGIFPPRN